MLTILISNHLDVKEFTFPRDIEIQPRLANNSATNVRSPILESARRRLRQRVGSGTSGLSQIFRRSLSNESRESRRVKVESNVRRTCLSVRIERRGPACLARRKHTDDALDLGPRFALPVYSKARHTRARARARFNRERT